jgi:putative DNA primase/helicase
MLEEYIEYKPGEKFAEKNAARSPRHEEFTDCGLAITDDDLVLDVDVVDRPVIEKTLHFFNIKTQTVWTQRGGHLYFKKPDGFIGNKGVCPLGIEIEYKHLKNSPNGLTIKQNGVLREIENRGERAELPDIFKYRKNLKSLLGLDEGDGRNDAMFKHAIKIRNLPQWKSIMSFINRNILAKPFDEAEFQTVIRDDVKPKAEKNNQQEIAEYLRTKYKIVFFNGEYYWFINNEYTNDPVKFNRILQSEIPGVKTPYYLEIIKQFEYIQVPIIDLERTFDIKFKNGILRKGRFIECDYKEFTPYVIDVVYDPTAEAVQEVDDYLDHISDGDNIYKSRILETMAHPFITDRGFKNGLSKIFMVYGGGGNGKGTFLKILIKILGENNCSFLSIKQLPDNRFNSKMVGKLANLGDDVEDEFITKEQVKYLKNISSCDPIEIRRLYEQAITARITTTLIFTSNHILKAREKTDAWERRLDWLTIMKKPSQVDMEFVQKLTTPAALKYWIKLIIEGYQRLYKGNGFTPCKMVEEFNANYHLFNDNINEFVDENPTKDHWIGKGKNEIVRQYHQWCEENFEKPQRKDRVIDKICKLFDLEYVKYDITKDGNRTSTKGLKEKST